jgi:AraC family transcriptional regulator
MEERMLSRQYERDMEFVRRSSSENRFWRGMRAAVFDTSEGFGEEPLFPNHMLSMHLTGPILAACRCDGAVDRRIRTAGDIHIIPAGYGAAWQNDGRAAEITINLSPELVRSAANDMGINADRISVQPRLYLRDPQFEHLAWALKAELDSTYPLGKLYADSIGLAMAAHLIRTCVPAAPRRLRGRLPRRRLQGVIDYIHDNLAQDLSLEELAALANLSPSHFKELFKRSVGMPVHQYVIRCRVEYAVDLLAHGKVSATEAALQAGFASQSHLARCMRRVTGMTPGDVRRSSM